MFTQLRQRLASAGRRFVHYLGRRLLAATKPCSAALVSATLTDLPCSKPALIAENGLLRQHLLILSEAHLRRVLDANVAYFNAPWPHQGLGQRIPTPPEQTTARAGAVYVISPLGGLHHAYTRTA